MRKILTILFCLLCVVTASAVSYGTAHRGSGHINPPSTARPQTIYSGGVMASAPIVTMGSTSFYSGRDITSNVSHITGIRPAGVGEVIGSVNAPFKIAPPDENCKCVDENHDGYCDKCGAELDENDGTGECSNNPCWCPIDLDWTVIVMMALLAGAYALYKARARREQTI